MMKFNQHMGTRFHANQFEVQKPVVAQKVDGEAMREQDLVMESLLKHVDQLLSSKMRTDYTFREDMDSIPEEDMDEAIQYFHRHYRPFIEVHFMDYKGQQVHTLTSEQRSAMIDELEQALKGLPLVPLTLMYEPEALTAVWEIPRARRFLAEEEFYKMRDNFLKMLSSIDFSTPIPTEDYYDSDLRLHSFPMIQLYKEYQSKMKPLQAFDQICGLEVCVKDK